MKFFTEASFEIFGRKMYYSTFIAFMVLFCGMSINSFFIMPSILFLFFDVQRAMPKNTKEEEVKPKK